MRISDNVITKIDACPKLLGHFNDSRPLEFMPLPVRITLRAQGTDAMAAVRAAAEVEALIKRCDLQERREEICYKMRPRDGTMIVTNIRAEHLAKMIEDDAVEKAAVGSHHRKNGR